MSKFKNITLGLVVLVTVWVNIAATFAISTINFNVPITKTFTVQGKSAYDNLFVLVEKDSEHQSYYFITKDTDNNYKQEVYFNFGAGEYSVSLYTIIDKTHWGHFYTYKITYVGTDDSNLLPSGYAPQTEEIKKLADEVLDDTMVKSKLLFDWVYKNIAYDNDLDARDESIYAYHRDATTALNNKKGVCYEKAVLYVAMLRSAKIPAKLIMGDYLSVANGKIEALGHAWVEFYDKQSDKWIQADPTMNLFNNDNFTSHIKKSES